MGIGAMRGRGAEEGGYAGGGVKKKRGTGGTRGSTSRVHRQADSMRTQADRMRTQADRMHA